MDVREELLATVATLYYKLNKSQSEIAARLDISSSTVSRMLREAHERGVVEIHIKSPIPRDFELEQRFIQEFGLKDVYILQTSSEGTSNEAFLDAIGGLAAGYIERMLANYQPGSSIGVAWGTGVHATVNAIQDNYTQNIDVVQLLGGVGALVVDSPDLARIVAQKLGGRHYDLHSPVLLERASTRNVFLQEPIVREAIERAKAVKLAITGIGTVHDDASSFLRAGLLTRSDLRALREAGAVGEMCGRFFDIQGNYDAFEINQRIVGIELDDLRRIPQSIAIARGPLKAASILGALYGNFLKVLATDDITARAMLRVQQELT
ncbi:MAG: sugar-binding transcriptional regulator [Anaerolineae bacterium]|nr:sugar-binding transcriptional regulator [Anaerolineae bacterium]